MFYMFKLILDSLKCVGKTLQLIYCNLIKLILLNTIILYDGEHTQF